jgi:hypothetical protein
LAEIGVPSEGWRAAVAIGQSAARVRRADRSELRGLNPKHVLHQVQTNNGNLHDGRLLSILRLPAMTFDADEREPRKYLNYF